jgi:hypothetical protein
MKMFGMPRDLFLRYDNNRRNGAAIGASTSSFAQEYDNFESQVRAHASCQIIITFNFHHFSVRIIRLSPAISSKSHPLHPSFTEFFTRFSPLYLISLQQRSLNLVLYTLNPILETYFVPNFCTCVFIIPQTLWTYFIFI